MNITTTTSVLWYFQFVLLAYSQILVLSLICDSLLVGEENVKNEDLEIEGAVQWEKRLCRRYATGNSYL